MAGPLARWRMFHAMEAARAGGERTPRMGRLTACGCVFDKLAVNHDGTITPCNMLATMVMGRIGETPIREIWRGHPHLRALRERREIPMDDLAECQGCEWTAFCNGSCPAVQFGLTGSLRRPIPRTATAASSRRWAMSQPFETPPLSEIYLYLAGTCNLRCRHCWIDPGFGTEAQRFLPWSELRRIFVEARELGLRAVKLTGGEPLMHPEILEILRGLREMGLKLRMESNGTLIGDRQAEVLRETGYRHRDFARRAHGRAARQPARGARRVRPHPARRGSPDPGGLAAVPDHHLPAPGHVAGAAGHGAARG